MGIELFEQEYQGNPPWEIGRPQPEVVRLAESGAFRGTILDCGCGTGENALYLAAHGFEVVGVDAAPTAIRKAREKTVTRNVKVRFRLLSALELSKMDRKFDIILDSGLFHVFSDVDRAAYVNELKSVLQPEGALYLICFSDREPPGWGPRRISRTELREAFGSPWKINLIREASYDTSMLDRPVYCWLASINLRGSAPSTP
jgi:SAM-dependent methyltransferase